MKVFVVAMLEDMHGLSNTHFHSPRLTWLQPSLNVQSASCREQNWAPNMTQFPRTLGHFHYGRVSIVSLLEWTPLDIDFPSLNARVLPKLPSVDYKIPYPPSWYFALLLIKELTSEEKKCNSGPTFFELIGLTMLPKILKELAWYNSEMAIKINYLVYVKDNSIFHTCLICPHEK